jgi:hypothetical protein
VQDDPTGRCHTADRAHHVQATGLDVPQAVEDIICYSWPLMSYYIGFYLSRGHMSDLDSQCNYPALSYKRTGQASILDKLS